MLGIKIRIFKLFFNCKWTLTLHPQLKALIFLLTLVLFQFRMTGQDIGNLRTKWIHTSNDTIALDSVSIIPGTVSFHPMPSNIYFNEVDGRLFWESENKYDSIWIVYRTFSYDLYQSISHKDTLLINPAYEFDNIDNAFTYSKSESQNELISLNGLQKSGNLSRGILMGNNRNLSVNSNLNLQLAGKISEDVEILASITDNNIPIQPEGNTQQIQDFDKIYIQLFNDNFKLIAGDYEMQSPNSYFTKYFKKNLGLSFQSKFEPKNGSEIGIGTAVAMSKGKFARNEILGEESKQGPYRLTGNANESFIIVLSGTERVYIDGILLKRGSNNEYVIDYNTAEIIFTPNFLITKDKRITVEFQYSDKNYFRSLVQVGANYKHKKIDAFINFYSEQDAKNQEQQQSLSESDKELLFDVGNDLFEAVVPAIDSTGYDPARVMYALIDSLGYDSIFVVSSDPENAVYQLRFSSVPSGIADYVQGEFTANGRTFIWVAPDTINGDIVHKGAFAPVRRLVAPQTQQMLSAGAKFSPDETVDIIGEVALSRFDPNTFSTIDNDENKSWAGKLTAKKLFEINKNLNLDVFGGYEYVNERFRPIERFRSVEFARNWNLKQINDSLSQQWWEGGVSVFKPGIYRLGYTYQSFDIKEVYTGGKQLIKLAITPKNIQINYNGSYLKTDEEIKSTAFYRHKAEVKFLLKPFSIGANDELENNQRSILNELDSNSYKFNDWKVFIEAPDKSVNKWRVYAGKRIDYKPPEKEFIEVSDALNMGGEFHYLKSLVHRFNLTLNYRKIERLDSSASGDIEPEDNLLGRLEYILRAYKGAISWNIFYQFGSGLDQKREFFYSEVSQGLGIYEWIDLNEDGIKDLNEFFISSNPALANYVRIFTPNNNFVKVLNAQLSQNLALNPSIAWQNSTGIKSVLARVSTQTFYSIDKTTQADQPSEAYNPFYNPVLDTTLLSYRNTFRNTVFINRSYTKIAAEYTYQNNRVKNLLLNGFQTDGIISHLVNVRWNITTKYTIILAGDFGNDFSASDFISDGNFRIQFQKFLPEFRYQPNQYFRISINGEITQKKNNNAELDQHAQIIGVGLESRYSMPSKGSLFANIKFIDIDYTGPNNTPSQVSMLETLRPGLNLTWSLSWQQNLNKFLQLSINYNGRKSEEVAAIHVGGVQVRAFF